MKKFNVSPNKAATVQREAWLGLVVLLVMSFGATGCSPSSSSVTRSPTGPAMNMAAGLYQRGEDLRTMAARGGVSYTTDEKRHYFKIEVVGSKPGRMLFTAFDPAGRPAFRLASDGQQLTGVMYSTKQYVVGPATADNFARFIPLGLTPDQLMALMSGAQVRPASAGARESGQNTELAIIPAGALDSSENIWRVRIKGNLEQDPSTVVVDGATLGSPRNPRLAIKYMSVKNVAREDLGDRMEPFPHSVEADWADEEKRNLRVTYDEVRLGLVISDDMFSLAQPDGFELVQLY